jgi:hypothetical protein
VPACQSCFLSQTIFLQKCESKSKEYCVLVVSVQFITLEGCFMKTLLISRLPVFALAVLLLSAERVCADDLVARSYDIKNVSEVQVGGGGRIEITQGDSETLRVEAAADVIDRVSVDLSGNKLTLGVKRTSGKGWGVFNFFYNSDDKVRYILQLKTVKYLGLSGATRGTLGDWKGQSMVLKASGASDLKIAKLSVDDLFVDLSGASHGSAESIVANKLKFELSGASNAKITEQSKAKFLEASCSGASSFHGKLLAVQQADVSASGASTIETNTTEFLKATASGASNVRYLGQPRLESNSNGASSINAIK